MPDAGETPITTSIDPIAAGPTQAPQRTGLETFILGIAPVLISVIVLVAFGVMLMVLVTRDLPTTAVTSDISKILLGALVAMAGQVVNYWLGSSSGSALKSQHIAEIASGRGTTIRSG